MELRPGRALAMVSLADEKVKIKGRDLSLVRAVRHH